MTKTKLVRTVIVTNPQGLHARPADLFVKLAQQYRSQVEVSKESLRVDGKSILDILMLAAVEGTPLAIEVTGDDAQDALDALCRLVEQNFADDLNP
ncbi:MAG: HPr family phosphocarrier protein [Pirellulales bacterium]|nr:HPr family phosphocarrier protein [Pirellulales bacterium]